MSAWTPPHRLLLATLALALVVACGSSKGETSDATDAADGHGDSASATDGLTTDGGCEVTLPALNLQCAGCHDLTALRAPTDPSVLPPRAWMELAGEGLTRVDPAIPTPDASYALRWPRRGHHDEGDDEACAACHPVRDDGVGHGVRTHPLPAQVFSGGAGCGTSCHGWLPGQAVVEGFEGADDQTPRYEGSLRPDDLLAAAAPDRGHGLLWREGASPDPEVFAITSLNPGCGGCHHLREESHGAMLQCLDCHRFGGQTGVLHARHVAAIDEDVERLDPALVAAGASYCLYCHPGDDAPVERARAACYNCHLSAHQPLDDSGRPQLWPAP